LVQAEDGIRDFHVTGVQTCALPISEKKIFRHNDVAHLEELLRAAGRSRAKLIVFESVYSMDGDIAPVAAIADLAEKYNAMTYIRSEERRVGKEGRTGMPQYAKETKE